MFSYEKKVVNIVWIEIIKIIFQSLNYLLNETVFRLEPEFLVRFEAWAKLPQQWLVCAPLGIHLEPIS